MLGVFVVAMVLMTVSSTRKQILTQSVRKDLELKTPSKTLLLETEFGYDPGASTKLETLRNSVAQAKMHPEHSIASLFDEGRVIVIARCESAPGADQIFLQLFKDCLERGLTHLLMESEDVLSSADNSYVQKTLDLCVEKRSLSAEELSKHLEKLKPYYPHDYEIELIRAARKAFLEQNSSLKLLEMNYHGEWSGRLSYQDPVSEQSPVTDVHFSDKIAAILCESDAKVLMLARYQRGASSGQKLSTVEILLSAGHQIVNVLPCVVGEHVATALEMKAGEAILVPFKTNANLLEQMRAVETFEDAVALADWDYGLIFATWLKD